MYSKMCSKSVWIGDTDNFLVTESWVICSKTLSCLHHRQQLLSYSQWLKAPSVHSPQSIAADLTNHPSCFYIQLLWSKGDMTWHLVRDLSKIVMWRSQFLGLWLLKLGEFLSLGLSQALSPVMCQGPLASQRPYIWLLLWLCQLGPQLLLLAFNFPMPVHSSINASCPPFPTLTGMNFHLLWASPVPTVVNECFAIDFHENKIWPFLFFLSSPTHSCHPSLMLFL